MQTDPPSEPQPAGPWSLAARIWLFPTLLALVLKVPRTEPHFTGSGLWQLDVVRPEACQYAAALMLTAWLLGAAQSSTRRGVIAGAAWLVAASMLMMEISSLYFAHTTGVHLDAPMVWLGLVRLSEVAVVVNSQVEVGLTGPFLLIAGAWLAIVVLAKPWIMGGSRVSARWLAVAAVLALVAIPPPVKVMDRAIGRSALVEWGLTLPVLPDAAPVPLEDPDAWLTASLIPEEQTPYRNVVVIWLESIGWDATSLGDLDYETTPVLARLAQESLVAEQAWSVVPHSTKSMLSIYCGVPPRDTMYVLESEVGGVPARCLPHLLRDEGYDILMMRSATRHFEGWTQLIANTGFETFVSYEDLDVEGFETVNYFGYEDDVLLPYSEQWIRERQHPWFITYMTGTAHHDYTLPASWDRTAYIQGDEVQDTFLNAVAYVDRFVGKVFELHKKLGVYEETVYILVADHGEAFGQHRRFHHDAVPYQEVLRVPLLVHAPGRFEGGERVVEPVSQLDIAPTIADLLGYRLEAPGKVGQTMLEPLDEQRVLHAHCWYQDRCQAARRGRWKLIHHYGNMDDELFDLAEDPLETRNVAAEHPEVVRDLRDSLSTWSAEIDARYQRAP